MKPSKYTHFIFTILVLVLAGTTKLYSQCFVSGISTTELAFSSEGGGTSIYIYPLPYGCTDFTYESSDEWIVLSYRTDELETLSISCAANESWEARSGTANVNGQWVINIYQEGYPSLIGGAIALGNAGNTTIAYNTSPGLIINSVSPSGGSGNYNYQWQSSTDNITWTDITGATTITYICSALVEPTYFRQVVSDSGIDAYSNVITIVVIMPGNVNTSLTQNYILSYSPQVPVKTEIMLLTQSLTELSPTVQYFDGLGRPKQVVSVVGSPDEKDIVQPIIYDGFGREEYKLLLYVLSDGNNKGNIQPNPSAPDPTSNYALSDQAVFYSNSDNPNIGLVQDSYPYSQTAFDGSPINRVLEQGAPGADWQPYSDIITNSDHTVKFNYETNTVNEVRLLYVEGDALQIGKTISNVFYNYYPANELYKTVVKDENWTSGQLHTTEEFKDKQGQVVLKRTYVEDGPDEDYVIDVMDTYYVYDDFNLLRYVLPPEAVKQMFTTTGNSLSSVKMVSIPTELSSKESGITGYMVASSGSLTLKPGYTFTATEGNSLSIAAGNVSAELIYCYKYDARKRMIEKKLPGATPVYMVYDIRDRLVATQDGNMRDPNGDGDYSDGQWLFTKYDELNRPVATGILNGGLTQSTIEYELNRKDVNGYPYYALFEERGTSIQGYTNNSYPITPVENDYHDYLTITYYDDYNLPWTTRFSDETGISEYELTKGSYFSNVKGLITATKTQVLDDNAFTSSSQWLTSEVYYDDHYRAIKTVSDLYPANPSNGKATNYEVISNNYDFTGKVIVTSDYQMFSGIGNTVLLTNSYDHAGRLTKLTHKFNNNDPVTLAVMDYNELGQLISKKLHPSLSGDGTVIDNVQEMDYAYNIRGWLTQINNPDNEITNASKRKFAMRLNYNKSLTGLTNTRQYNGNISAIEWSSLVNTDIGVPGAKQAFAYNYDAVNRLTVANYASGNNLDSGTGNFNETIGNYDLNGNIGTVTRKKAGTIIDDMVYTYAGNQLLSVNDNANDAVGFIETSQSGIEYSYDANGNMLKDLNKGLSEVNYNYLNLPEKIKGTDNHSISYFYTANGQKVAKMATDGSMTYYAGSFIYKGTVLDYLIHPEGLYAVSGIASGYQYNLKDHLGNVRMVINSSNTVVDQSDYYSFGMLMTTKFSGGIDNLYKYNGKELQEDQLNGNALDWYDYGARFYDAQIGRWMSIDPLAEEYRKWSPYNYCMNNPLSFNDPDGRGPLDWFKLAVETVKAVVNIVSNSNNSGSQNNQNNSGSSGSANTNSSSTTTSTTSTQTAQNNSSQTNNNSQNEPTTTATTNTTNNNEPTVVGRLEKQLIATPKLTAKVISDNVISKGNIPVTTTINNETGIKLSTTYENPLAKITIGANYDFKIKPALSASSFGIDAAHANYLFEVKVPTSESTSAGILLSVNKQSIDNALKAAIVLLLTRSSPAPASVPLSPVLSF